MLKNPLCLLILLISAYTMQAQADKRVFLKPEGYALNIQYDSAHKVQLVDGYGNIYSTLDMNKGWFLSGHEPKEQDKQVHEYSRTGLLRFNKDIQFIPDLQGECIWRTNDNGHHWQKVFLDMRQNISCASQHPDGKAWMGSSQGNLYYTNDYAASWHKLPSPFNFYDDAGYIYMSDSLHGIAAGKQNSIFVTCDNWQTATHLPTPQAQLVGKHGSACSEVDRLFYIGSFLVASQDEQYFYTDASHIQWRQFPVSLQMLRADTERNILYGISNDGRLLQFHDNMGFTVIDGAAIQGDVYHFRVNNGHILVLSGNVCGQYYLCEGNAQHIVCKAVYAADKAIETPRIVDADSGQVRWGGDCSLYRSDDKGKSWVRIHDLPFRLKSVTIKNQDELLLSDDEHSYIYHIATSQLELNQPAGFLNDFLKKGITRAKINTGSTGCFHYLDQFLYYEADNNGKLVLTGIDSSTNADNFADEHPLQHFIPPGPVTRVSLHTLKIALQELNNKPYFIPHGRDFGIKKRDIDEAIQVLNDTNSNFDIHNTPELLSLDFGDLVQDTLQLGPSTFRSNSWCTTSLWIGVTFYNANRDSVTFYHRYFPDGEAWCLPWTINYKGTRFSCYHPAISHAIGRMLPEYGWQKYLFSNAWLLIEIAGKKLDEGN